MLILKQVLRKEHYHQHYVEGKYVSDIEGPLIVGGCYSDSTICGIFNYQNSSNKYGYINDGSTN